MKNFEKHKKKKLSNTLKENSGRSLFCATWVYLVAIIVFAILTIICLFNKSKKKKTKQKKKLIDLYPTIAAANNYIQLL